MNTPTRDWPPLSLHGRLITACLDLEEKVETLSGALAAAKATIEMLQVENTSLIELRSREMSELTRAAEDLWYALEGLGKEEAIPMIVEAMGGWQPIETAPKDARLIWLGSVPPYSSIRIGFWNEKSQEWIDMARAEGPGPRGLLFTPTHWMPIPRPPGFEEMRNE